MPTIADYERLPEHVRADFVGGALVMTPAPTYRHEQLLMRFVWLVADALGPRRGDRVFVSRFEVRAGSGDAKEAAQPDVVVLPEPLGQPGETATPPLLVAEILSSSTASYDRGAKLRFFARARVREAWILDPVAETVEIHDLSSGSKRAFGRGESAASAAVPGVHLDVSAFFAD